MFLLLQDGETEGGEHRAVAFVCCHPAGFDPSSKLGKRLAEIHGPVPAYEKIGASMERYFGRLEVGRGVKRVNVSFFFAFSCRLRILAVFSRVLIFYDESLIWLLNGGMGCVLLVEMILT